MRTTVYQSRQELRVKQREIWIGGLFLNGSWITEGDLLRRVIAAYIGTNDGIELHVNNKFVIDAERDEITDEIDDLIIERFDELKLNFGEAVRVKLVAIAK